MQKKKIMEITKLQKITNGGENKLFSRKNLT